MRQIRPFAHVLFISFTTLFLVVPALVILQPAGLMNAPVNAVQATCANPTFTAQSPLAANGRPRPIVTADFNGDGKPDLAVGNSISLFGGFNLYNITTLLNNGTANGVTGFTAAPGSPRGIDEGPISIAAADFNGDGKIDLAVAGEIAKTVSILLGDGTGDFISAGTPISFPSRPTYVVAADLNADAKIDLAVVKADDNNVNIMLGNGSGGFADSGTPLAVGTGPFFAAIGNFNSDNRPDLAVANLNSQNVTILLNNAGGGFTAAAGSPVSVQGRAYAVAAADFNGDAKTDLAVKNTVPGSSSGYLSVLLGNGSGGFAAAPSVGAVAQPATVGFFGYIVPADFDKDGKPDLVVANPDGADISVWLGDGAGGFKSRQQVNTLSNPYAIAVADFDGGGVLDLAVTFESQEKLVVFQGGCSQGQNMLPVIVAAPTMMRQQGSAGVHATIATVSDAETPAANLVVAATTVPAGMTVNNITNTNGTIGATITAGCNAQIGARTIVLTVTDANNASRSTNLTVTVTANPPPALAAYPATTVTVGNSATVTPSAAPTDNGSITSLTVVASASGGGGFTGALTINQATGVVTAGNAGPVGSYTATVTATDNCNVTSAQTFPLTVTTIPNTAPTIAAAAPLARQQGSPGAAATIAMVNDAETTPGNLFVTALTDNTIVITSIINTNGTITATVAAACNASPGANTIVLKVTDSGGQGALMATANLIINVAGNTPPALGGYPVGTVVNIAAGVTVTPSAAPADNGAIPSITASASPGFAGNLSVDSATGAVTISNARPAGEFSISIMAADNCGATTPAGFSFRVAKLNTTIALAVSAGPYIAGQPVMLMATVAGASGLTPGGTVTFFDGTTSLGTAQLNGAGMASLTTSAIPAGARGLTATYGGDASFNTASSAGVPITVARAVTNVSAANYQGAMLAAEEIVAAFGTNLATATVSSTTQPLPTTLGGTAVRVRDSAGTERLAPLFFVSPTQINYLIPAGTTTGTATVTILSADGSISLASVQIGGVAPGIFSADATGAGLAAAVLLRLKADGSQVFEAVTRFDAAQSKFVAVPIDFGAATDQLFLIPYGTGVRNRTALSAVNVKIGGTDVETLYAGPQGALAGLDQINARLPRTLAGRGEVAVAVTVDGRAANAVKVNFR